jgi:hypothetical protein
VSFPGFLRPSRFLSIALVAGGIAGVVLWFTTKLPAPPSPRFLAERQGWCDDFTELSENLANRYPNIEWTLERGDPDVFRLHLYAYSRVSRAKTRQQAAQAMREFVDAFRDGHLALIEPAKPTRDELRRKVDVLSRHTTPELACFTLGYKGPNEKNLPFEFKATSQVVRFDDSSAFAAEVLRVNGRRVGIVRIPSFMPTDYPESCRGEWNSFRQTLASSCEARCRNEFGQAVQNRLVRDFETRVRQFKRSGVELLVLDLTGNRGGYAWSMAVGNVVGGGDLPLEPVSFVRGRLAVGGLERCMRGVERALAICGPPPSRRRQLEATYRRLVEAQEEARAARDCPSVWGPRFQKGTCTWLTQPLAGVAAGLGELGPGNTFETSNVLLVPMQERQPNVVWRGRLAVLIDSHSASAAEVLAGKLKDYAGATLIGNKTAGAGGGWRFARSPILLPHTGLELYMPDSVAYRRDGSNYRAGVEPDIRTGWTPETSVGSMTVKLWHALEEMARAENP